MAVADRAQEWTATAGIATLAGFPGSACFSSAQVRNYSQHTSLESMTPYRQGRTLLLRFNYTTGDACGQNMVTTATWNACKWALDQIKKDLPGVVVTEFFVETTASGDKQTLASTLVLPRGVHVQAEAWIPESVLQSTLKVICSLCIASHFEN